MLRANLQAARTDPTASSVDESPEVQQLRSDLARAQRQVSELQETSELFREQQGASVQAAAALQAEVTTEDVQ